MCGIAGIVGPGSNRDALSAMIACQRHRGPDAEGAFDDPLAGVALGHNRLAIIDLSPAGRQPMASPDGRFVLVFNGEIYNYLELRAELTGHPFRTQTDSEVLLAAYERWGAACLDRLIGMFAFLLWDTRDRCLFAARDRFGVKPLYYHVRTDRTLLVASEIKALHAAGIDAEPDCVAWATYLAHGLHDHGVRTFWRGIQSLPAGHSLTLADGRIEIRRWYDVSSRALEYDERPVAVVEEEYMALLHDSVRLRFRADVPVGINLSGGLDSSTLLAAVQTLQGAGSDVKAFTFVTADPLYDELPWVQQMLARTRHPLVTCPLAPEEVPRLTTSVQAFQDEPFGGLPTLAYAKLFEQARAEGVIVLLDGQGMDEQWAGYDYYRTAALEGRAASDLAPGPGPAITASVQGTSAAPTRPQCLTYEFRTLAEPLDPPRPFPDSLRNLQYRDARFTKIPRALRFNDRVSMRSSTELREPFLDHRLFELALRQPADRKISERAGPSTSSGQGKVLLRRMVARALPDGVVTAPKRPLQTPQREWLRGPLQGWVRDTVESAIDRFDGTWLDGRSVRRSLDQYFEAGDESSFHIWQLISLGTAGLLDRRAAARAAG